MEYIDLAYVLLITFVGAFLGSMAGTFYVATLDRQPVDIEVKEEPGKPPVQHKTYHGATARKPKKKKEKEKEPGIPPEVMNEWMYGREQEGGS